MLGLGFLLGGSGPYEGDHEREWTPEDGEATGPTAPLLSVKIKAHGAKGKITYENGDVYTGNWVNN